MALSNEEQDLLTWLLSSIPKAIWMDDPRLSKQEVWTAAVKSLILVQRQAEDWQRATYITEAEGVWLNLHAKERGTNRQAGELDPGLRDRLRNVADAVTVSAIVTAVRAYLDSAGYTGPLGFLELRQDKGFFNTLTPSGDPIDSFAKNGNEMTMYSVDDLTGYEKGSLVTIAGAAAGNNGTFRVTDVTQGLVYTNAAGIAGISGGTYQLDANHAGKRSAYFGRGYRMARGGGFILILPYGTFQTDVAAIREILRQRKAAGFSAIVEQASIPNPGPVALNPPHVT